MCDIEDLSNSEISGKEVSTSETSKFYDYLSYRKSHHINIESKEHSLYLNEESDCYSVEREICNTQLHKIQEEQIEIENYIVPIEFSNMFNQPSTTNETLANNIFFSTMYTNDNVSARVGLTDSKKKLKPTRSKSLTEVKFHHSKYLETERQINDAQMLRKYSDTFLNCESTLQELNQQNILAQELLRKYFREEPGKTYKMKNITEEKCEGYVNKEDEKALRTVSSMLNRYFRYMDKGEQVCLKPSDNYVFLNSKDVSSKKLDKTNASLKFVRPFKYHKKFWDSGSNLDMFPKTYSPFKIHEPLRKKSKLDFNSNVALKQDSSTDMSLKTENVQFLPTVDKNIRQSETEMNKILYKTDSKDFENTYSLEELHHFEPKRNTNVKNSYNYSYAESVHEQLNKPRYNFQTLLSAKDKSKSPELGVKFFDSGSHIKVTDDDYKKWLEEKDFLKYTGFAKTSVSSLTYKSVSKKIVNYALTPVSKSPREKKRYLHSSADKNYQTGFNKLVDGGTIPTFSADMENSKDVDLEYNDLYQLALYEHIVISKAINFYCSFNATRIKKLTTRDRAYQLIFVLICYYTLSIISNVFNQYSEKWF